MKQILLFGAGKSSTALIRYFLQGALESKWCLTVVDASLAAAQEKLQGTINTAALSFDIHDAAQRQQVIAKADVVLSLMPPQLHILIANDCLSLRKHLITASYADAEIKAMAESISNAGILFLYEMGLDPGIDHMSAKKLIDEIKVAGGQIHSFYSHCGGLVAPESDDNPWHYKISWNPRNVVMAGKAGAVYRQNAQPVHSSYHELFKEKRIVNIPGEKPLCWYPNRDSLSYIAIYGLEDCSNFIRTTLRHPDFIYGWNNLIDLRLTDEAFFYDTNGLTLKDFFKQHFEQTGFGDWLKQRLGAQVAPAKSLLDELMNLMELEKQAGLKGIVPPEDFMLVDENGGLKKVDIDNLKTAAAGTVAEQMYTTELTLRQLFFLGMNDDETVIDKGRCNAADVLQYILEKKLPLLSGDKDRVVMLHEIGYTLNGENYLAKSSFVLDGENGVQTAMAKTVGLPMAIAAEMILDGRLQLTGLQIPTVSSVYKPVLETLSNHGILFREVIIKQ